MIDGPALIVASCSAVALAALAGTLVPPTRRLAPRLRPYTVGVRSGLGKSPDVPATASPGPILSGGTLGRLFGPPLGAIARRLGRMVDSSNDERLLLKLQQAGLFLNSPEEHRLQEYRIRQLANAAVGTLAGAGLALLVGMRPALILALGVLGFVVGITRWKGRVDRTVQRRRERMRIEIYTINHLLAMRVRVGGGVLQAAQHAVERGRGAVVEELAEALRLHRSGLSALQAFGRIGRLTPEPQVARTYHLLAAAEERGSDLARALLALSEDVREARREALKRAATKRRAAMLVPIIAILAPIMLLFVAAPIPSIIFGGR